VPANDAGRGFAVVAQEVCVLATRSGEAARKTMELVGSASERVGRGVEFLKTVRSSLEQIIAGSTDTGGRIDHSGIDRAVVGDHTARPEHRGDLAYDSGSCGTKRTSRSNCATISRRGRDAHADRRTIQHCMNSQPNAQTSALALHRLITAAGIARRSRTT
jgi:hypothetical protein